jgi:hypothetical protein
VAVVSLICRAQDPGHVARKLVRSWIE